MRFDQKNPPRVYPVGDGSVKISDCGNIALEPNEQLTFTTEGGGQHDVARKEWGFYATASTNSRLSSHGLRTAIVRNSQGRFYVMLCERGKEALFDEYLTREANRVVVWLDGSDDTAAFSAWCDLRSR